MLGRSVGRIYSSIKRGSFSVSFSRYVSSGLIEASASKAIDEMVLRKEMYFINMPALMDEKEGNVKRWLKKEGDSFIEKDGLCEIAYKTMTIEYDAEEPGILSEILVYDGQFVAVNQPIAACAINKEAYMTYIDLVRTFTLEKEMLDRAVKGVENKSSTADTMLIMKQIKRLIQSGQIVADTDFAKKLQTKARKGDKELIDIFQASFDGVNFNEETFDTKFFISNARDLIENK